MKPSIFNDVIGPVMRGPSSSHTAASHRIGSIIRQICAPENGNVLVEFDRKGSLATTYEGQGSSMGLICGLLGVSILDPSVINYNSIADEHHMNIKFHVTDFEAPHPNTYKIHVECANHEKFQFLAISTGGGMIEIKEINGFEVSIKGDFFETLLYFDSISSIRINELLKTLMIKIPDTEVNLLQNGLNSFLVNFKSRQSIIESLKKVLDDSEKEGWIKQVDPVMPILGGVSEKLPFSNIEEMLAVADKEEFDLADLGILYETTLAGIDSDKVHSLMREIVLHIKESILAGLKGTTYADRILGHQSHLILEAEKMDRIIPTPQNTIIAYVSALMEAKSSMGVIVAAPTAGSAGVLGGAIFGVATLSSENFESVVKAFLAAGLIGVFIADKYTFAAESGGCQVECGAASGMAAAGLVQLMGGTVREAVNAASMALQNVIGMVCDPVADRVEVPCLGKNIMSATNALNAANMSIAGFDPVIPLNEVIDAMKSVGEVMPSSLRCTGLGGLSVTPASLRILQELKSKKRKN